MGRPKLSPDTARALERSGYRVSSLYQRPVADSRKLKQVCEPADPWTAHVYLPDKSTPVPWFARKIAIANGATADEAVIAAIPRTGGLMSSYRLLGEAIDSLTQTVRGRPA